MALHLTKVAFGAASVEHLSERLALRAAEGQLFLTTHYLPKRHEEVAGAGSLFWILKHQLVARSAITGFGEAEGGRVAIFLAPPLVLTDADADAFLAAWPAILDAAGLDAAGLDQAAPA